MFADWTDRIRGGEVPPAPPRPQGPSATSSSPGGTGPIRRRTCTTSSRPIAAIRPSTPRGPLYGALELSADYLPVLDPVKHVASAVELTVRDPNTPATSPNMPHPSPYWGSEPIWKSKNNVHNPMFDEQGRVWITSAIRAFDNPDYCKAGSSHPSAKLTPLDRVEPASRGVRPEDASAHAHQHLLRHAPPDVRRGRQSHAVDERRRTGGRLAEPKMWDETGDEAKSQGWTALIMDTNGNGRRDAYVEPERAGRSDEGSAVRRRVLLGGAGAGRIGVGHAARVPGRGHPLESGIESAGDGARRGV